VGPDK